MQESKLESRDSLTKPTLSRNRYSVSLLFGFVTFAAILAGMLRLAMLNGASTTHVGATIITTACVGALLGIIIGAHHRNRFLGVGLGIVLGFLTGATVGPIVLVDRSEFGTLIALQIGGAALIVVVTWLFDRQPSAQVSHRNIRHDNVDDLEPKRSTDQQDH